METPVTKTGTTNGNVELENRLKYYEVSLQTLFRRYWSRWERRKGRGELLSPVPQSTAARQATKDVSTEAGTQGGFCSHKLPISVGKGLLLPPALSTRKSGVRTKLGVTTASADNRTGMSNRPASPSANYTGATDLVPTSWLLKVGETAEQTWPTRLCNNGTLQASELNLKSKGQYASSWTSNVEFWNFSVQ